MALTATLGLKASRVCSDSEHLMLPFELVERSLSTPKHTDQQHTI